MDQYRDLNKDTRKRRTNRRRKRKNNARTIFAIGIALVILLGIGAALTVILKKNGNKPTTPEVIKTTDPEEATTDTSPEREDPGEYADLLKEAERYASMYDYEKAVDTVKKQVPEYEKSQVLKEFVASCNAKRSQLILWNNGNNSNIPHVFFHTLIVDEEKAWNCYKRDDYNQVMTTVDEFNKIIQQMYENGFVLVHLSDIAAIEKRDDGTESMTYQPIYLPSGKKPFVLSIDDTNYYEYMCNTGCATKLIVGEDGKILNEMATYKTRADGQLETDEYGAPIEESKEIGNFDVIPLLNAFVEEHPDFSYHGAKGTCALTGYNGILGYKTSDIAYGDGLPEWQKAYEYRCVNIEEEKKEAKKVAEAIKATGWKFASHTWGHMDMGTVVDRSTGAIVSERFTRDTEWWLQEVAPLIGGTDIIIFAFGADIGTWRNYPGDGEAYTYLKEKGFDYYCNVDSSAHAWIQLSRDAGGDGYLRTGRRNLDGTYMYKALVAMKAHEDAVKEAKEKGEDPEQVEKIKESADISDLYDVTKVFSRKRPLPVPNVKVPEGMDPYSVFDLIKE